MDRPTENTILDRLALSMSRGMNITTGRRLIERLGSESSFFSMGEYELSRALNINSAVVSGSYRHELRQRAGQELEFIKRNDIKTLYMSDDSYPRRLAACEDAPVLLYQLGEAYLDSRYMVAIVGTRHATPYGVDMTTHIVSDLAQEYGQDMVIVSGLAYGIDVAAHKAALRCGIPTVAVAAHPLNTIYPADHRAVAAEIINSAGAIVTEYSTTHTVHKGNFLARNRIVAGLCDAVIVIESDIKGGAMTTARIASEYNRDVFAVPGRCCDRFSRGTNKLIANNTAMLLTDAGSLADAMNWPRRHNNPVQKTFAIELTETQKTVYRFINDHPDFNINEIIVNLGISYAALANTLMELEMADLIKSIPGNRYMVTQVID